MYNKIINVFGFSIGLILCVGYSTTFGGFATIVGSAVTIFLTGYVDRYVVELVLIVRNIFAIREYKNTNFRITFSNYLVVALPTSALMLIFCWIWLQIRYGLIKWPICKNRSLDGVNEHMRQVIKQKYDEFAPMG